VSGVAIWRARSDDVDFLLERGGAEALAKEDRAVGQRDRRDEIGDAREPLPAGRPARGGSPQGSRSGTVAL
jgi:hypothetical protein